jgi:hypothetical protein
MRPTSLLRAIALPSLTSLFPMLLADYSAANTFIPRPNIQSA